MALFIFSYTRVQTTLSQFAFVNCCYNEGVIRFGLVRLCRIAQTNISIPLEIQSRVAFKFRDFLFREICWRHQRKILTAREVLPAY